MLPRGTWMPYREAMYFHGLIMDYRSRLFLIVDWAIIWVLSYFATFQITSDVENSCRALLIIFTVVFYLLAVVVLFASPYSSALQNILASLSFALMGSIYLCSVDQVRAPEGPSRTAFLVLFWILVAVEIFAVL